MCPGDSRGYAEAAPDPQRSSFDWKGGGATTAMKRSYYSTQALEGNAEARKGFRHQRTKGGATGGKEVGRVLLASGLSAFTFQRMRNTDLLFYQGRSEPWCEASGHSMAVGPRVQGVSEGQRRVSMQGPNHDDGPRTVGDDEGDEFTCFWPRISLGQLCAPSSVEKASNCAEEQEDGPEARGRKQRRGPGW